MSDTIEKSEPSSELQQSSENQLDTNNKNQKVNHRKDDNSEKLKKLLGYCPRKLPGERPQTVISKQTRLLSKASHPAQNTALLQKPSRGTTEKGRYCHIEQQIDNSIEKINSDDNANPLSSSDDNKPEMSKGSVTESSKDASLPSSFSDGCQENLPSKIENKKSKKGRLIPSRYMDSAKKVNKQPVQCIRSMANCRSAKQMVPGKRMVEKINMNSTPAVLTHGLPLQESNEVITSTPAIHAFPFSNDMSSIMADATLPTFDMKTSLAPFQLQHKTNACTKEAVTQKPPLLSDAVQMEAKAPFVSPTEIMYCRYLQAIFLEAKATQTLKKKSQNAKEQLISLWEKNQELMEIEANLDLEISALENQEHLSHHLESQEKILEPMKDVVEKMNSQCNDIAKALDTTRHQLPLSGIFLSDVNDLSDALKETEKLSELLVTTVKPHEESLVDMASNLSKIEDIVDVEKKDLHRCFDLARKFESLTIQEGSLQIQSIDNNIELGQQPASSIESSVL